MSIIILILIILFLFISMIFVAKDTVYGDGKWGINLELKPCPKCGANAPSFRIPSNLSQFLWGGWTCNKCGCEIDKWGKIKFQNVK